MKVMVGVDDSPCSRAALEFFRKVSWPADTRVIVVSSVNPAVFVDMTSYSPADSLETATMLDELTRYGEATVSHGQEMIQAVDLRVESRVLQGDPRRTLVEEAKAQHVDLIVVGSHGRAWFQKLMLGSVASHVAKHAPCSALVVKH